MRVRDAAATKERILSAAFDEFTAHGFAGARVDAIAANAQCNKALIYSYCGSKEALFRQVLEAKMAELSQITLDADAFADTAGRFFDFHAANPWLSRLMQWEALDFGTGELPNEDHRCAHWEERVEAVRDAQRRGAIDPALDARQTLFTLVGLITFWFTAPQIARMICGGDPYSADALAERRSHVMDVARRIVEKR
jgi:AcrR family transcriptional regulator